MFAQLGSTVFDGLFSFDEFKKKIAGVYAELPLIGGKPDLQRTGKALDIINISIRLHDSFCIPYLRYSELVTYCENGDILPFIDGYGDIIGNFVIEELEQNVLQTDIKGRVTHCTCEVSLREFVDPNRALSKSNTAKRDAFALGATSLTIKPQGPPLSAAADVFKSIKAVNDQSAIAVASVSAAAKFVDSAAAYINQGLKAVQVINQSAIELQSKVEGYGDQLQNGANLVSAAVSIGNNANQLKSSLEAGNIPASLINSSTLTGSVTNLGVEALPVQKLLILR